MTLIAGSNRKDAASTKLLCYIGSLLNARQISVAFIDLQEHQLPFFSPAASELHPNARFLQETVADADGLILATPEYHGSVSGMLKNALDHLNVSHVEGKPVLSVSSAGGLIGVSSLMQLQGIVRGLHGINCSEWISIGYGSNLFGPDGAPLDEGVRERVEHAVGKFTDQTRKLAARVAAAN